MIILMWFDKHKKKNYVFGNLTLFCSHSDDATGGWFRVLSRKKVSILHTSHTAMIPSVSIRFFRSSSSSTAVNGQQQQLDIVSWDTHKVERIREWNVERVWHSLIFFVCKLSHQFTSEFYNNIILQSEKRKAELRWTWERSNRSTCCGEGEMKKKTINLNDIGKHKEVNFRVHKNYANCNLFHKRLSLGPFRFCVFSLLSALLCLLS